MAQNVLLLKCVHFMYFLKTFFSAFQVCHSKRICSSKIRPLHIAGWNWKISSILRSFLWRRVQGLETRFWALTSSTVTLLMWTSLLCNWCHNFQKKWGPARKDWFCVRPLAANSHFNFMLMSVLTPNAIVIPWNKVERKAKTIWYTLFPVGINWNFS